MQQIVGLDEMYLSLDTGRTVGHVAAIAVFDPHDTPRDELEFLRTRIAERLTKLPILRFRMSSLPLHLTGRYFADGEVDIREYVSRVQLPSPGTDAQFKKLLDELMGPILERDQPMWRMWLVEGLEGGRYAYVLKLSHGMADGSVVWKVFDQLSDSPAENLPEVPIRNEPVGGAAELVVRALVQLATMPMRGMYLQGQTAWWAISRLREQGPGFVLDTLARAVPGELSRPLVHLANRDTDSGHAGHRVASLVPSVMPPHTPFNGTVSANLTIEEFDLQVADLSRIGKLVGGTVNDALLAVTAGAMRSYLATHGGIPERPVVIAAPISWRDGTEKERWANQVWMLYLPLPTHLADPMERLRYAQRAADTAKFNWDGMPSHLTRKASEWMPTMTMAPMTKLMSLIPGALLPKMYNVSISNVRGPKTSPSYGGQPIEKYFVYGFLPPGCGMLVAGQSLEGRMVITATVCRDIVVDHAVLPALLQQSLEELLAVADTAPIRGGATKARARRSTAAR